MKTDGTIQAFPFQSVSPSGEPNSPELGVTLRDYFALHASDGDILDMQTSKPSGYINRQCARYMVADAMLAEREKVAE